MTGEPSASSNGASKRAKRVVTPKELSFESYTPDAFDLDSGILEAVQYCLKNNIGALKIGFRSKPAKGITAKKVSGNNGSTEIKIVLPGILAKQNLKVDPAYITVKYSGEAVGVRSYFN